jgi:isopenicillin N synthase-like dioxygenase
MIPELDLARLRSRDAEEMRRLAHSMRDIGFLVVTNTGLEAARVQAVLEGYRQFFALPQSEKQAINMARTGSNRGWGASGSEQVDPDANPDYKQVFDCGHELPQDHPMRVRGLSVYAPNQWPDSLPEFRALVQGYYQQAGVVAMDLLRAMAHALGREAHSFDDAFDPPMALLRGNYYPSRPEWAGDKDFGIAAHTDYGCLTLLATDGTPGLEVQMPDGAWRAVSSGPGRFVVNFGEMFEMWSGGQIKATPHRVVGGPQERLSIPLFFNPSYDTNVAAPDSGQVILAGDHLSKRFNETYLHLAEAAEQRAS